MIPTDGEAFRRAACGIVAGVTLQFAENTTRIFENISIERLCFGWNEIRK